MEDEAAAAKAQKRDQRRVAQAQRLGEVDRESFDDALVVDEAPIVDLAKYSHRTVDRLNAINTSAADVGLFGRTHGQTIQRLPLMCSCHAVQV